MALMRLCCASGATMDFMDPAAGKMAMELMLSSHPANALVKISLFDLLPPSSPPPVLHLGLRGPGFAVDNEADVDKPNGKDKISEVVGFSTQPEICTQIREMHAKHDAQLHALETLVADAAKDALELKKTVKASHSFDLNLLDSMVDAAVAKHSGDSYFGEMKIQVDGMQLQLETMLSVKTIETQTIFTMEKDFTEFKNKCAEGAADASTDGACKIGELQAQLVELQAGKANDTIGNKLLWKELAKMQDSLGVKTIETQMNSTMQKEDAEFIEKILTLRMRRLG